MANQNKDERAIFSPEFLTPEERQDRIVEILTRGVLRLIDKKRQAQESGIILENSAGKKYEQTP